MTVSAERSRIRQAGRSSRQELGGSARAAAERSLIGHLQSLTAMSAKSVGVFIAHDGEPDLTTLIEWLWAHDQTVALPVLADDPADHTMRFVPWLSGTELRPGRFGIPVPPNDRTIEPETLVVSLTGFDPAGNRIGRGGGFFDRYLANFEGSVIGVGFESQRFDLVPTEDHDVALPAMVTDLGVRFFP